MSRRSRAGARYAAGFGGGMVLYSVLMLTLLPLGRRAAAPWSYVLVSLPAVGLIVSVWALAQYVRDVDEYQRTRLLYSLAGSIAITTVVCFIYGMCAQVGAPAIGLEIVPAIWAFAFGIATALVWLRDR